MYKSSFYNWSLLAHVLWHQPPFLLPSVRNQLTL